MFENSRDDQDFSIRAGSLYPNVGGKVLAVRKVISHPEYDPDINDNDFGLVKLAKPLKYNDKIRSISLTDSDTPEGTTCQVTGWGKASYIFNTIFVSFTRLILKKLFCSGSTKHGGNTAESLLGVMVPIFNFEDCKKQYGYVNKNMICAGYKDGGKDACQGDSGGPMTCLKHDNLSLVGVVSFGHECALPDYAGVYASIMVARSWIKNITGI